MPEKYKATLQGDKITWDSASPIALETDDVIPVYITIIENNSSTDLPDGKKMAEVLRKLSAQGGISSIKDGILSQII